MRREIPVFYLGVVLAIEAILDERAQRQRRGMGGMGGGGVS